MKTIAVSIDTARSKQAVDQYINEHLRGKEIPLNAAVEILWNGNVLHNYQEV